jgi:hypothetical protein
MVSKSFPVEGASVPSSSPPSSKQHESTMSWSSGPVNHKKVAVDIMLVRVEAPEGSSSSKSLCFLFLVAYKQEGGESSDGLPAVCFSQIPGLALSWMAIFRKPVLQVRAAAVKRIIANRKLR